MILLDTNVISEAIKPMPHPSVRGWLDAQAAETLFLSSVTVAEMTFGIRMLPAGRRKQALEAVLAGVLALFAGRVLAFDEAAACATARWWCGRARRGKDFRRRTAMSRQSRRRGGSRWRPAMGARSWRRGWW